MEPSELTESLILQHTYPESFGRGEDYFRRGAVMSLVRQGNSLLAEVVGSQSSPYRVTVTFLPTSVEATCTCPVGLGSWCKHIVAALLAYLDQADSIEERPKLEDLLGQLDRNQLQDLLLQVVRKQPALADLIDREISLLQHQSADRTKPAPVDTGAYRVRVHSIVHGFDHMRRSDAYWHMGEIASSVSELVEDAWQLILSGGAREALAVLDAITSEYFQGWTYLDDSDGEASAPFAGLGAAWTEAVLTADLSAEEREDWADRLDVWSNELYDYGIESLWEAAMAAKQGWDHPLIQAALRGEPVERRQL